MFLPVTGASVDFVSVVSFSFLHVLPPSCCHSPKTSEGLMSPLSLPSSSASLLLPFFPHTFPLVSYLLLLLLRLFLYPLYIFSLLCCLSFYTYRSFFLCQIPLGPPTPFPLYAPSFLSSTSVFLSLRSLSPASTLFYLPPHIRVVFLLHDI